MVEMFPERQIICSYNHGEIQDALVRVFDQLSESISARNSLRLSSGSDSIGNYLNTAFPGRYCKKLGPGLEALPDTRDAWLKAIAKNYDLESDDEDIMLDPFEALETAIFLAYNSIKDDVIDVFETLDIQSDDLCTKLDEGQKREIISFDQNKLLIYTARDGHKWNYVGSERMREFPIDEFVGAARYDDRERDVIDDFLDDDQRLVLDRWDVLTKCVEKQQSLFAQEDRYIEDRRALRQLRKVSAILRKKGLDGKAFYRADMDSPVRLCAYIEVSRKEESVVIKYGINSTQ